MFPFRKGHGYPIPTVCMNSFYKDQQKTMMVDCLKFLKNLKTFPYTPSTGGKFRRSKGEAPEIHGQKVYEGKHLSYAVAGPL